MSEYQDSAYVRVVIPFFVPSLQMNDVSMLHNDLSQIICISKHLQTFAATGTIDRTKAAKDSGNSQQQQDGGGGAAGGGGGQNIGKSGAGGRSGGRKSASGGSNSSKTLPHNYSSAHYHQQQQRMEEKQRQRGGYSADQRGKHTLPRYTY